MLSWLPDHPNFSAAIRAIRATECASVRLRATAALAMHERDAVVTQRLDRLATDCLGEMGGRLGEADLTGLRLAVLSSHSADHLVPAIRAAALTHGLALSVHVGAYGQFRQALLCGDAALGSFDPQVLLLALDAPALLPKLPLNASAEEGQRAVQQAVADVRQLWREVRSRYGAQPIHQTIIPQLACIVGSNEMLLPASPASLCDALDLALRSAAREDGIPVLDVRHQLPEALGADRRFDPVRWHQAKQLINPVLAPLYGELAARVLAAVVGRVRKCLVLDLDNTLWGGVIGDDGLAGVKLGQGSAEGEAYLAFQHYVGQLAQRGIILAVCSKNDHAVARAMFEQHPEMHIRYDQVACFIANWTDKATNLREIAKRLNIGLDSLVFVDDNPAERAIVRRELPQVAVPELPEDVAYYPERLAAAGYFETIAVTHDDFGRSQSYASNAGRVQALEASTDMDGYLRSLEMSLSASTIDAIDLVRSAQLINKSNQFNLTTKRRTEQELAALLATPHTIGLCFRLRDRFGDNGLISVILATVDPAWGEDTLLIDTWLMSCRVLGRGVECAALEVLADIARARGKRHLVGEYRPSGRNNMVASHFDLLGFTRVEPPEDRRDGSIFWHLPLAACAPPAHHLRLEIGR